MKVVSIVQKRALVILKMELPIVVSCQTWLLETRLGYFEDEDISKHWDSYLSRHFAVVGDASRN